MAGTALMKGVREDAGTSNNGKINQISFLKKTRGLFEGWIQTRVHWEGEVCIVIHHSWHYR